MAGKGIGILENEKAIARKLISSLAISVYSGRLFSEAGNIFDEKRDVEKRLLLKTGKQFFLHYNIPKFPEILS